MRYRIIIAALLLSVLFGLAACKYFSETEYNVDKSACNGCNNCANVCPSDAIWFDSHGKAIIDQTKCTTCGDCVAVCPQNAIY